MTDTIDLTRNANGDFYGMDIHNTSATGRLEPEMFEFLEEVKLSAGIRACYFRNAVPKGTDFTHFDLAMMKIPVGFQYIDYNINDNREVEFDLASSQLKPALKASLLTPLLVPKNSSVNPNKLFHICENKTTPKTRGSGSEGCSELIGSKLNKDNPRYFELFYYKNEQNNLRTTKIYQEDDKGKSKNEVEFVNDPYFLIPLVLSEKLVVYYVIDANDPEVYSLRITDFYRQVSDYNGVKGKSFVDMVHSLVLSDKLGIFTSKEVEILA